MIIRKVLCIDDSAAELGALRKLLEEANMQVALANSGKEGIQLAKSETPDLIFLDILMPDMDGYSVMRELQKDLATKVIPVVFVSSKSQKADQAWAKIQGGKGFIPKPVNREAILKVLNQFL